MIVEKQRITIPELRLLCGATLNNVPAGYETYGRLNAARDNAILVCHYFSGTSHAAGRYRADDAKPGYWDEIIGPGKAVDTDRFFVISVDSLCNLNAFDPNVATFGPASLDPAGKPFGLRFPAVAIADFVRLQKAVLDALGIERLHAVMGPSMGGLQTFEWAASFPEKVGRIIPVIVAPNFGAWLTGWLSMWAQPIRLDPAWRGGDYYATGAPKAGLEAALKLITLHALDAEWADTIGRGLLDGADPADLGGAPFAIELALAEAARERAALVDANHLLYLVRANQTYIPGAGAGARDADEGLGRITAPALMIYAPLDQVFRTEWVAAAARKIGAETFALHGPYGHYNGIQKIADAAERIKAFLDS
ncbi:homoserine O-acetyltransferase [Rhodoblastus acidophilus]|uniref:alpha/beta fold hydrolase n=1 Tax=Rhodoblastus acidophilus TaxID=1074 RepID=UPI002223F4AA|nr:homoserine O-acetyltransferase [Rhodoblastus acidophilus]MCW2284446.1 homoserine O-acetyltransferase [Rhodoblastus acidophilus]MCW2333293.1 homoserine O-acetyltransferase [Rhodoblastus acidophilus]